MIDSRFSLGKLLLDLSYVLFSLLKLRSCLGELLGQLLHLAKRLRLGLVESLLHRLLLHCEGENLGLPLAEQRIE